MTVITLTVLGAVASAFYVLTWTPAAIKARLDGMARLTWMELIDFAALPVGVFLLYVLAVWNIARLGITVPHDVGVATWRIVATVLFDLIVGIRLVRWIGLLVDPGAPISEKLTRGAFSDRHHATEGTDDNAHGDTG